LGSLEQQSESVENVRFVASFFQYKNWGSPQANGVSTVSPERVAGFTRLARLNAGDGVANG
jgi:hypothetical protein